MVGKGASVGISKSRLRCFIEITISSCWLKSWGRVPADLKLWSTAHTVYCPQQHETLRKYLYHFRQFTAVWLEQTPSSKELFQAADDRPEDLQHKGPVRQPCHSSIRASPATQVPLQSWRSLCRIFDNIRYYSVYNFVETQVILGNTR